MSTTDFTAEVAAGAAWLDANYPDWVRVFAADEAAGLEMRDCESCVIGHVLGDYGNLPALQALGPRPETIAACESGELGLWDKGAAAITAPLGFSVPWHPDDRCGDFCDEQWDALGAQWRTVIGKRLAEEGLLA